MSLSGNGLISTAVSANETTSNGTENLDWNDRCYAYVQEDVGLDVCHQESFQTKESMDRTSEGPEIGSPVESSGHLEKIKRVQIEMKQESMNL